MPAKFCAEDGCYEVAIGAARSRDHCRPHYRDLVLKDVELIRCQVVCAASGRNGERAGVTDARTNVTVYAPGIVELDPAETNIAAVVAAGAVKVLAKDAKVDKKAG
jgi:hypothetical protein